MANQSQILVGTQVTVLGAAQQFIRRLSAAAAERRALRQTKIAAQALQQMDPRLLADIGVASSSEVRPMEQLARLNPAVVAASVFSLPHNGR